MPVTFTENCCLVSVLNFNYCVHSLIKLTEELIAAGVYKTIRIWEIPLKPEAKLKLSNKTPEKPSLPPVSLSSPEEKIKKSSEEEKSGSSDRHSSSASSRRRSSRDSVRKSHSHRHKHKHRAKKTKEKETLIDQNGGLHISLNISYRDLDFSNRKKLGQGTFGVVYRITWQNTVVAVKKLLMQKMTQDTLTEFKKESTMMAKLRHPNIIQLFGICAEPGKYCMVMEYMPKGSLYDVLHSSAELKWPVRWQIAFDMGCGLSYLHNNDILHRDLKSLNVLMDTKMKAKLTDFGLSKVKTESSTLRTADKKQFGTSRWMAPEVIKREGYVKASDIFSYGIILWELASRQMPFADAPANEIVPLWIMQGQRDKIPAQTPPSFATLIKRCWDQRKESRPSADETVQEIKKNLSHSI